MHVHSGGSKDRGTSGACLGCPISPPPPTTPTRVFGKEWQQHIDTSLCQTRYQTSNCTGFSDTCIRCVLLCNRCFFANLTILNCGAKPVSQWRIQDFPQWGAPTPKIAIIFHIFAENCMKMKEFGPQGGRVSLVPPLGSANVSNWPSSSDRAKSLDYVSHYSCQWKKFGKEFGLREPL